MLQGLSFLICVGERRCVSLRCVVGTAPAQQSALSEEWLWCHCHPHPKVDQALGGPLDPKGHVLVNLRRK